MTQLVLTFNLANAKSIVIKNMSPADNTETSRDDITALTDLFYDKQTPNRSGTENKNEKPPAVTSFNRPNCVTNTLQQERHLQRELSPLRDGETIAIKIGATEAITIQSRKQFHIDFDQIRKNIEHRLDKLISDQDKRLKRLRKNTPRPKTTSRDLYAESITMLRRRVAPSVNDYDRCMPKMLKLDVQNNTTTMPDTLTNRSSEDRIKLAVNLSYNDPFLIGDFSQRYCLPLIKGKHQDLKSITAFTLANVLQGNYSNTISDFIVIDCRYPYEFEGGHIKGAMNFFTKDDIKNLLLLNEPTSPNQFKHIVLIFHCEFSSKRGPTMSRYLRNQDRTLHGKQYPKLKFPEMYLLDGGYKHFFEGFPEWCDPNGYRQMIDPAYRKEFKFYHRSERFNYSLLSKKEEMVMESNEFINK